MYFSTPGLFVPSRGLKMNWTGCTIQWAARYEPYTGLLHGTAAAAVQESENFTADTCVFCDVSVKILPTAAFIRRSDTVRFLPYFLLVIFREAVFVRSPFLPWAVGGTIVRKWFIIVRGRRRLSSESRRRRGRVVAAPAPDVCARNNRQNTTITPSGLRVTDSPSKISYFSGKYYSIYLFEDIFIIPFK